MHRRTRHFPLACSGMILFLFCCFLTSGTPFASIFFILTILCAIAALPTRIGFALQQPYLALMLKISPNKAKYYTYRGKQLFRRKQYEEALQEYNRASALGSKLVDTYAFRGEIYLNRKEYQFAIQDFDQAIALNPHHARAYSARGYAYFSLKEPQKAIQDFDQAIACAHWPAYAIRDFDFDQAFAAQRMLPQTYLLKGLTHVILEEKEQAIQSFNKALKRAETKQQQAQIYRGRALAYLQMREYRKALPDLHFVLAHTPPEAQNYVNCGVAHYFLQEHLPVVQALTQAIELDPQCARAYVLRSASFLALNNLQQARADCERAWEIDPQNTTYSLQREWARLCADQEKPDEQIANHLIELAETNPKRPDIIHFCRGFAHWTRGKYEEALAEFEPALQLDPDPTQWDTLFWKGMACASLGRVQEARAAIQTALDQAMPPILLSPLRWLANEQPELYREFIHLQE